MAADTPMDVQAYRGMITEIEHLRYEFMCKFVGVHTQQSLLVKSGELVEKLEYLADNHVLLFSFFRGAYGYSFTGKIGSLELVDDEFVVISVLSPVEQYNRRKSPRVDVFTPVSIFEVVDEKQKGEMLTSEAILDISSGGLSVVTNSKLDDILEVDKDFFLDFKLGRGYFSMRAKLVHSGFTRNLFTYKYLHAFEFQDQPEAARLSNAIFDYGLKGH